MNCNHEMCSRELCQTLGTDDIHWIWCCNGQHICLVSKRHRFESLSQQSLFSLSWRCKMVIHIFSHTMEQRRQLESQLWQLDIDKTIFSAQLRFSSLLRRVVETNIVNHFIFVTLLLFSWKIALQHLLPEFDFVLFQYKVQISNKKKLEFENVTWIALETSKSKVRK